MKVRHYIILFCSILLLAVSCSQMEFVEDRVGQIQQEQDAKSEDAWRSYFEGQLTEAERDALIAEADARAREALGDLPEEVKRRVELEKGELQERGSRFVFSILDILLGAGVLGGAGVAAGRTLQRRKENTEVQPISEDPPA
jgi:hypothetical protein